MSNATFSYGGEAPVLSNVYLTVFPGELVAVAGPVGAGKTTLLLAFLGEVEKSEGSVWTEGTLAYVAQGHFILSGVSLRENILFGASYDEAWYNQVLYCCSLVEDIKQLPYGDQTPLSDQTLVSFIILSRVYYSQGRFLTEKSLSS